MKVLNKHHLNNCLPAGAVNIMRGSIFGNPFVIGQDGTREEVIAKYKAHLWHLLKTDHVFTDAVRDLLGNDLYCCCAPKPCHGDVLISACKWLNKS